MNVVPAITNAPALGALASLGADAPAEKAGTAAAQEFAALLGAAMQQAMKPAAPKVAVAEIVDATMDDAPVAVDGEVTEDVGDIVNGNTGIVPPHLAHGAKGAPQDAAVPAGDDTIVTSEAPMDGLELGDAIDNAEPVSRAHAPRAARKAARAITAEATDHSTATLDPEFATKLTRVLDRMRDAGYDVEVVETTRSSARQQSLYAQGRTTDGPVVTWTLDSRHLSGNAADLAIEGKNSANGYALLHQFAKEEGLRTLGARDPGHIEMPRTTVDAKEGATARRGLPATSQGAEPMAVPARVSRLAQLAQPATVARVAEPARVAQLAQVAQVAQVARVARVAQPTRVAEVATVAVPGAMHASAQVSLAQSSQAHGTTVAAARGQGGRTRGAVRLDGAIVTRTAGTAPTQEVVKADAVPATESAPSGDETNAEAGTEGRTGQDARAQDQGSPRAIDAREVRVARSQRIRRAQDAAVATMASLDRNEGERVNGEGLGFGDILRGISGRHAGTSAPVGSAGRLAAARVAELLAARDAAPAPTVGELRLALDPQRDGLSEVRLALDGAALDATLRTTDAGIARGLQGEVASLARALEKHGFETARVAVALDAAQQSRAQALDSVAGSQATAGERATRGDGNAAREGRDERAPQDAYDMNRDRQHGRRFGGRRAN